MLANLGNFVLRALSFAANNFDGVVPKMDLQEEDWEVIAVVNELLTQFLAEMETVKMRDAIQTVLSISRKGNQYMQTHQPWVLVKDPSTKARAGTVIGLAANLAALLSTLLYPFMPATSRSLSEQCGLAKPYLLPEHFCQLLQEGHKLGKVSDLFLSHHENIF